MTMSSETSLSGVHDSLGAFLPIGVPAAYGGTKHVAGGELRDAVLLHEPLWPGSPCPRPAVLTESVSSSPLSSTQLRLLDQTFILLGDQMSLDLGYSIKGHADNNQKRSTTKG